MTISAARRALVGTILAMPMVLLAQLVFNEVRNPGVSDSGLLMGAVILIIFAGLLTIVVFVLFLPAIHLGSRGRVTSPVGLIITLAAVIIAHFVWAIGTSVTGSNWTLLGYPVLAAGAGLLNSLVLPSP